MKLAAFLSAFATEFLLPVTAIGGAVVFAISAPLAFFSVLGLAFGGLWVWVVWDKYKRNLREMDR